MNLLLFRRWIKLNQQPLVSIIIPVYNSEKTLGSCLKSIENQSYTNIEIIVVESRRSSDKSLEIADKYNCRIFSLEGKERSPAINYGFKVSKGKYVYRVDSDVVLDKDLVNESVKKCEIEGFDAVSIFWSPDPTISFWAKVRKLEKECYKGDLDHSGARFFRKEVFASIGGFDENLVAAEDYDLSFRLEKAKINIGIIKAEELHLGEPKTIKEVIQKQYYYGKTLKTFLNKNNSKGLKQLSPFRGILFKNWKKFVKNPLLTFGFIFYEFIIYSSATTGYFVSLLKIGE